ncbi:hypothetical protein CANDROIZ_130011 [Candidatus Roizmanbacteria bacterium]|nr:hypothetical protein CANDROIZ_130011 [Candidatus Roizmanbacteria bacterium]
MLEYPCTEFVMRECLSEALVVEVLPGNHLFFFEDLLYLEHGQKMLSRKIKQQK